MIWNWFMNDLDKTYMKKIIQQVITLVTLCWMMAGCSHEDFNQEYGEGVGYLRLALGSVDVELLSTSRAETGSLPEGLIPDESDFMVDIQKDGSSIEGFPKKYSEITDDIELMAGSYTVKAEYGDNGILQTTPYFAGSATVQIFPGKQAKAEIGVALADAMLSPAVSESLQNHYTTWKLTVEAGDASMTLADQENTAGCLFVQAGQSVKALFEGTNRLGNGTSHEWSVISSSVARTKYVLQCDPDLSIFSGIQLTATATHTYNNEGLLTGTDVLLNFASNGAPLDLVDKCDIQLLYNGTPIRTYTDKPGNDRLMTVANGWPYVPQGSTLTASIHLRTGETIDLTSVKLEEIPIPDFIATVSGKTSYSVYRESGAGAANSKDGSSIFDISATATIAPEILNNPNYANILKVTYTTDSGQNSGELSFGEVAQFNSLAWQKHELSATVSFDGVEKTSLPLDCHVTGLPYRAEPPRNEGNNPWRIVQNGTLNYIEFNDTYVLLRSDGADPIIGSSPFYIPNNINFKLQSRYKKNGAAWFSYQYEINLLSGNTIGDRICYNDAKEEKEYIVEGVQTFTPTNNAVSCRFESNGLWGANANLIYVYIDYE